MTGYTIYHNPRCSKSRQTLALLNDNGIQPEIVLYLEEIPSAAAIRALLKKLGLPARGILRKGEETYKAEHLSDMTLTDKDLIAAMITYPKLIERPIVTYGDRAIIGRPPENVRVLIDEQQKG